MSFTFFKNKMIHKIKYSNIYMHIFGLKSKCTIKTQK